MTTRFDLTTRRAFGIGLVSMLLVGAAFAQPAAGATAEPAAATAFAAAQEAYERNHWSAAYDGFAALADRGHAEAARIALLMARSGPTLYGSRFAASEGQRQRWAALAACAGGAAGASCSVAQRAP